LNAKSRVACCLSLILVLSAPYMASWVAAPNTTPGANLSPIRGMSYQPAPSDYSLCNGTPNNPFCPYYDTDFFNRDFTNLWGSSTDGSCLPGVPVSGTPVCRGDLIVMAHELGVNFLHLYNWNPARDHLSFLNEAHKLGIGVAVPINNYFTSYQDPNRKADIEKIVDQVYVDTSGTKSTTPHPAVVMWTIANEYEISGLTPKQVAEVAAIILAHEKAIGATVLLPISVPVSFATKPDSLHPCDLLPGFCAIRAVEDAFKANPDLPADFISTRFVAATNPQNDGAYITGYLPKFAAEFPGLNLWFAELGGGVLGVSPPTEAGQAAWLKGELEASKPQMLTGGGLLLGSSVFEFENEYWKAVYTGGVVGGNNDATFGIYKFSCTPTMANPAGTAKQGLINCTPEGSTTYSTPANGPSPAGTYRVDILDKKPNWMVVHDLFDPLTLALDLTTPLMGLSAVAVLVPVLSRLN